jgi:FemAB-related protein (PEP-CTERM system-associated)
VSAALVVRRLENSDRRRWDDYVAKARGSHFGQTLAWMELTREAFGCEPDYRLAESDGVVRGVLPLFLKRPDVLFTPPGGLLADDETAAQALLAPARERVRSGRLRYLELRDQARAWGELATSDEHCTLQLELAHDVDTQWKSLDTKLRNQIRKGQKSGFTVRWGRERPDLFYRVFLECMRDLGTPILGARYFRRALELLGPMAELLVLEDRGEPAGAMFVVAHADTLVDPWAASLRRYFPRCPNQVLYWEAIQYGIRRGLKRFDFGRSQWNSSTFRFKEQWGAKPVPLYYQYSLGRERSVPSLEAQKHGLGLAVAAWKRLPLPVAAALGARVRRMFPEAL